MAHAFDPSSGKAEACGFLSSRPVRDIERKPVSKNTLKMKKEISEDQPTHNESFLRLFLKAVCGMMQLKFQEMICCPSIQWNQEKEVEPGE